MIEIVLVAKTILLVEPLCFEPVKLPLLGCCARKVLAKPNHHQERNTSLISNLHERSISLRRASSMRRHTGIIAGIASFSA
jgi:hypothetical protein